MCFKNLPVEFDPVGNAALKGGVPDPYDYSVEPLAPLDSPEGAAKLQRLLERNGAIRKVDFDPVTRVAGALAFHSVVDLENREVIETDAMGTLFRGYEVILKGRDPRDAIFISSRACGVCGGVHATTSALCLEMAFGISPPPMGVVARNLMLAIEFLYDNSIHLGLLAGPDFSEPAIRETNPELWDRAQGWTCPNTGLHGYATMAELMSELTPLTGKLYLESLHMTRVAREAYVLIGGKFPHPQTIVPGGISATIDTADMSEMELRIVKFFDYGRKLVAIWDDLTEFFYEANPQYAQVGRRAANMIENGLWDDPFEFDATYENANAWGRKRWAPPGVIVDGELATPRLTDINIGIEEFVEHSFYEPWAVNGDGGRFATDVLGQPLSPHHPWNKETIPKPGETSWKEKYSWGTAPRWDRMAMECGAYARLWCAAKAPDYTKRRFIEPTGDSLKLHVPKAGLPAAEVEWKVPHDNWGAFERNRARAYSVVYSALVAYDNLVIGYDFQRKGQTAVSVPHKVPRDFRVGAGFWSAGRGFLSHWMVMDRGVVENYQIVTPSTWNASPRDPMGNPGPYEEAVLQTPILENYERPEDYKGIDILRAIRSFDPCMPCTTHIHTGTGVISREVVTCACGAEDDHAHD